MKNYINYIIALIMLASANILSWHAYAEGWLQPKGQGIFISSFSIQSFYGKNSSNAFDKKTNVLQSVLNLYGEYGLTRRITVGAKVIGVNNDVYHGKNFINNIDSRSFGVDTINVFTRLGIIRHNDIVAFSIASQIGAPNIRSNDAPYFDIHCWSYETRAELGLNLTKNDFLTIDVGLHANINYWYDEVRTNITFGHYFIPELLFIARFQKYAYIIKNTTGRDSSIFDIIAQSGFAKASFSFVAALSKRCMLEVGFYSSIKSGITFTKELDLHLRGMYTSIWWSF